MGKFNFSMKNVRVAHTPVYFDKPGRFICVIRDWKHFQSRQKHDCFAARVQVIESNNPEEVPVDAFRDLFFDMDDTLAIGPGKLKGFLIAAHGLSTSLDADELEETTDEKWLSILELSLKGGLLGNKIEVNGVRTLKKDAKKAAKENPELLDDPAWMAKNSFVAISCEFHKETRDKMMATPAPKKAAAK